MRALLAFVLALALLAGCTAKEEGEAIPDALAALAGPSEEELARTPGVLQGIVHTPELAPIAGARVTDVRLGIQAVSDPAGFFRLEGLVTGEHLLTVEAANYHTRSVLVNARNGTTLEVNVSLVPDPPKVPYVETRELAGFLACAALVAGEARDCASADPNHRDIFEFDLAPDARTVVVELVWDPEATPTAQSLGLDVETVGYGAQDIELGHAAGEGYARVVLPGAALDKYYPEGGVARATVTLAEGAAPVSLAFQTEFVVYVTVFYHEAGPAEFTIRSA